MTDERAEMSRVAPSSDIIFRSDGGNPIRVFLVCAAITALGLAAVLWNPGEQPAGTALGYSCLVSGGLCSILSLQLFRVKGTSLTINASSITIGWLSLMPVPWSAVESVDLWYQRGVRLRVAEGFMQGYRQRPFWHLMNRLNRGLGFPGLWIATSILPIGASELHRICSDYWNAAKKEDTSHV